MIIFDDYRDIIPDFDLFQTALRKPFPIHLRVNTLKTEPASLIRKLRVKGVGVENSITGSDTLLTVHDLASPGNLLEYYLGYIHPQALTSCLAPVVLSPKPGSYVLDMCASPGGKTSQIAQIMDNNGLVIANELFSNRHIPLGNTLSRLGVTISVITAYQAQEYPLREKFDYVLADVPCSGEGRFRITSGHSEYKRDKGRRRLPEAQKRMITRGFDLLKEQGEMVYSTCTYNPEENESVVDFLLKNREDALLLPINVKAPFDGYLVFRKKKGWWILKNSTHISSAAGIKIVTMGLRAFHKVGSFVKPSTRMIQVFGHLARKNVLDIGLKTLGELQKGEYIPYSKDTENGYVILSVEGRILGLGLLINGRVRSQISQKSLQFLKKG